MSWYKVYDKIDRRYVNPYQALEYTQMISAVAQYLNMREWDVDDKQLKELCDENGLVIEKYTEEDCSDDN